MILVRGGGLIRGPLSISTGRIWLTSRRVVFQPTVMLVFWILMPLVALVMHYMNKSKTLELELGSIASQTRGSFGRNKNVLELATATDRFRLLIDDFDPFVGALTAQPAFTANQLAA